MWYVFRFGKTLQEYLLNHHSWPLFSICCFILLEDELPRANSTSALSGAGVLRLFNRVGETVNKITFKMDENDPVSEP